MFVFEDHAWDSPQPTDKAGADRLRQPVRAAPAGTESLRYRRQILALKHFFARHDCTVLMLDDMTSDADDQTVRGLPHGVIRLEALAPTYGAERRRLR